MGNSNQRRRRTNSSSIEAVAGNGLLDRRMLLGHGVILAGAASAAPLGSLTGAAAEPPAETLTEAPWSLEPGAVIQPYQLPSRFEKDVVRTVSNPSGQPSASAAKTPHHLLSGTVTPNGLHFVVVYGGVPDIDPDKHRLVIHGLVRRPLVFTLDALARYPMVTRMTFLECGGNSTLLFSPQPLQQNVQVLSFWESKVYAQILPNGKAYQFYLLQEVKSYITQPSPGLTLKEPGLYEISGIAYSGAGRITKVMVSADGGRSWAEAALQEPVLSKAFTRFRMPWRWDGGAAILQSRAWDELGNVQPTRAEFVAKRGELKTVPPVAAFPNQHFNAVTSWAIDSTGGVKHAYA